MLPHIIFALKLVYDTQQFYWGLRLLWFVPLNGICFLVIFIRQEDTYLYFLEWFDKNFGEQKKLYLFKLNINILSVELYSNYVILSIKYILLKRNPFVLHIFFSLLSLLLWSFISVSLYYYTTIAFFPLLLPT